MATPNQPSDASKGIRSMFELKGRNYVVTGGAQGIGLTVTAAIAEMGGNVAVIDLQEKPSVDLDSLAKQFGVKIGYFNADVSNEEQLKAAFDNSLSFLGSFDGCVTSAGIAMQRPFVETPISAATKISQVNVIGTFASAQFAAQQMQKQGKGGSLVLIASILSHTILPRHRMAAYSASKGAVRQLSQSLAVELAGSGIRVNSISPGFIDSYQTRIVREETPALAEIMFGAAPLNRIGQQSDLIGAVVYLLSDAANYTTGADIAITGGLHIGRIDDFGA